MPKWIGWKQKMPSAIIANDTVSNSVKLCLAFAKPDTDMGIIAKLPAGVNPCGGNIQNINYKGSSFLSVWHASLWSLLHML